MATAPQFDVIIKNDNLAEAKQKAVFLVKDFIQKPIPRDEEE
jgi:guanylate kinase